MFLEEEEHGKTNEKKTTISNFAGPTEIPCGRRF